mmetsp:Transcript_101908/g.288550  ORF Transcript_101908/g.288550 Transcript_101908/m.288550 type:complete len:105 (+) Transcript_101908:25-339(+)
MYRTLASAGPHWAVSTGCPFVGVDVVTEVTVAVLRRVPVVLAVVLGVVEAVAAEALVDVVATVVLGGGNGAGATSVVVTAVVEAVDVLAGGAWSPPAGPPAALI